MGTRTPSKESIVFESPAEINAAMVENGEMLQIELKFPGLRKSSISYQEPIRERRGFFSCFNTSKDSQPIISHEWFKFIEERRHSGDWITVPTDRKPDNCDLWLQIFRNRISVMLSPQDSKSSKTSGPGVTQYFFWNSGCMNKALNLRKCEMLINNDFISLRLACGKGLWSQEDVETIQNSHRGGTSQELIVEGGTKFPESDMKCDESISFSTFGSAKEEKSARINSNNLIGYNSGPVDDVNAESSTQDMTVTKITPKKFDFKEKATPNLKVKDFANNNPEQEELIGFIERATSCTDLRLFVDASVATTNQNSIEEDPKPCHYCQGVQQLLGNDEFSALQARVEALDIDDWARVMDIIMSKNNSIKSKSPLVENQEARKNETLVKNVVPFRAGNQQRLQRKMPLRHARYLVLNNNQKN